MLLSMMLPMAFAQVAPPIVNGETTSDFPAVGVLVAYSQRQGQFEFCSGTLVHAKWVTTAAHCIVAAEQYHDDYNMDILFMVGTSVHKNDAIDDYDVAVRLIQHPDYNSRRNENDVGLVELETGITSVEPIPIISEELDRSWRNEIVDFVGWGITSDNRNDSGTKRWMQAAIYDVDDSIVYTYDSKSNLCSGDSGGAALYDRGNGRYELIGANSFVFAYQSNSTVCVGGGAGVARLDNQLDWVYSYVPRSTVPEQLAEPELEPADDLGDSGDLPVRPSNDGSIQPSGACSTSGGLASASFAWVLGLGLLLRRRGR